MALLGERGEGTGGAVDGGVADGEDGNHNYDVHDGWKAADAGVLNGDDEWTGLGVGAAGAVEELVVGVWDEETDDGEGDDVEKADTPENLLNRGWERLARVGGLSGGETDQLCTGESEGCCYEHGTKTLESVVECAWVAPVLTSDVTAIWSTAAGQDDTKDDEPDDSDDLDDREEEFRFTVALDTEQINADDNGQEDGDPGVVVNRSVRPEFNGECGSDDFER